MTQELFDKVMKIIDEEFEGLIYTRVHVRKRIAELMDVNSA